MYNFSFLTEEQIWSENRLSIFKKYDVYAPITDYAIFLGGVHSEEKLCFNKNESNVYTGHYWTKTTDKSGDVFSVNENGLDAVYEVYKRIVGARPITKYSDVKDLCTNKIYINGVLEVEFGEYPQMIVSDKILSSELEAMCKNNRLELTGKTYTYDENDYDSYTVSFIDNIYYEYIYQGKKYVRVLGNLNNKNETISDGTEIERDESYWIKVEPVKWFVDELEDVMVSKNILFAGIQFSLESNYEGDFGNTEIKWYMNEYFSKEILASHAYIEKKSNDNLYNIDFNYVSNEEIIKGCIESNIPVMLHGRSGDGKSARVKELDPDCEIIYLINASPDSLCGKSILNNGEMIDIPPTWYTNLLEKCEREPNKIHIVFFDEITNASASIQGMAFNIILDKEINGKWKLPDNTRIVAVGNELEESRSAYGMSEPLFNRFAHVYIETKVEDFLKWASKPIETKERLDYKEEKLPMKIHPLIYAFIACKKEEALRTKYTGNKPNADPRKWEMASKVLYNTGKINILKSLVGEDVTNVFEYFCKERVISIHDIISGNYTDIDLEMYDEQKYKLVAELLTTDVEYINIIRAFIKKLGTDFLMMFDRLYIKNKEFNIRKGR